MDRLVEAVISSAAARTKIAAAYGRVRKACLRANENNGSANWLRRVLVPIANLISDGEERASGGGAQQAAQHGGVGQQGSGLTGNSGQH